MNKKFLLFLLCIILSLGLVNAQQAKKKTTNKVKPPVKQQVLETALSPRSADCFFAIPLQVDSPFGPTEPPRGYGFVSEISRDARVKNVFEAEHNSVWYIISIPYAGKLCVDLIPKSMTDDYDMLIYKYTNKYFCNRIIGNKVTPLRSILSSSNIEQQGKTGINTKGTMISIPKSSDAAYGKYIEVLPDEKYIIVVDNLTDGGLGHTISATINTDFAPLTVLPIDSANREKTTANLLVKDAETENIVFEKENVGSQQIKLLPKKAYSISLKKDGYFNYFREVSHAQAIKDSILTARLVAIKVGAKLPIKGDLFFDIDEQNNVSILPESYPALEEIVKLLQDYPNIYIEIIGRIPTEGLNLRKDVENSRLRAEAIKNYLIGRGIVETNLKSRGSSIKELEEQLLKQKKVKSGSIINPACEIKILKTK